MKKYDSPLNIKKYRLPTAFRYLLKNATEILLYISGLPYEQCLLLNEMQY